METATIEKYVPWVLGGGALLAGVFLYRSGAGSGSSLSYQTVPAPDNSAAIQAAQNQQAANLAAEIAGLQTLTDYATVIQNNTATLENNRIVARNNVDLAGIDANRSVQLATIDAQTQQRAIKSNASIHKTDSTLSTIASIATLAVLVFCYDTTEATRAEWGYYQ